MAARALGDRREDMSDMTFLTDGSPVVQLAIKHHVWDMNAPEGRDRLDQGYITLRS